MTRDLIVTTDDGSCVAVRDFPTNGPPVVLLHGAGLNLALWDGLASRIESRFHLVALDFFGHGESTDRPEFSLDADLAAVDAVIAELDLGEPAVVGHSYGGILAVLYGAEHPRCPQVVNVDGLAAGRARPDHFLGKPDEEVASFWIEYTAWLRTMLPATDQGDDAWLMSEFANVRTSVPGADPDEVSALLERGYGGGDGGWLRHPSSPYLLSMVEGLGHVDIFDAYRRSECPVAVVLAQPQEGITPDHEAFLRSYFAGFAVAFPSLGGYVPERRLFTLECGHGIPLEAPDELAVLIDRLVPRA